MVYYVSTQDVQTLKQTVQRLFSFIIKNNVRIFRGYRTYTSSTQHFLIVLHLFAYEVYSGETEQVSLTKTSYQ